MTFKVNYIKELKSKEGVIKDSLISKSRLYKKGYT
jgi:hypothetical protein